MPKFLFFDCETTGLDVTKERVTQLAWGLFEGDPLEELQYESHFIFDETYPEVPEEVVSLTGITTAKLSKWGSTPFSVFNRFLRALLSCDYLVAHNALGFDVPLIKNEFTRAGVAWPEVKVIDTRLDLPLPKTISSRRLIHLCAEHGFLNFGAHSARHDVDAMVRLFSMYSQDKIIEISQTPMVRAVMKVHYDSRDEAKKRGFFWDGENKQWFKDMREYYFSAEYSNCAPYLLSKV